MVNIPHSIHHPCSGCLGPAGTKDHSTAAGLTHLCGLSRNSNTSHSAVLADISLRCVLGIVLRPTRLSDYSLHSHRATLTCPGGSVLVDWPTAEWHLGGGDENKFKQVCISFRREISTNGVPCTITYASIVGWTRKVEGK